jgi:hypothetical protein
VRPVEEVAASERPLIADESLRSMSILFLRSVKTSKTERLSFRYISSLTSIFDEKRQQFQDRS